MLLGVIRFIIILVTPHLKDWYPLYGHVDFRQRQTTLISDVAKTVKIALTCNKRLINLESGRFNRTVKVEPMHVE